MEAGVRARAPRDRAQDEDESALVERARADGDAFAALYDRYVGGVYRFAYRRIGDHSQAEEITSQTFQRALEALPRYQERGLPFGAWLFRIARNLLIDSRRSGPRAVSLDALGSIEEVCDQTAAGLERAAELREQLGSAWAAVNRLPPLQRRAVALRFGQDLSHKEIGRRIGRSEVATKQIMYRAIKTLREQLIVDEGAGLAQGGEA
jgi:RNA polymerase sigma-70 factor, ECF subfamily